METVGTGVIEHFLFHLIVPLEYDASEFQNLVALQKDCDAVKQPVQSIRIDSEKPPFLQCFFPKPVSSTWQLQNSRLLQRDEDALLVRFELVQTMRNRIGLHNNHSCSYMLEKERLCFEIRSVRLWFTRFGSVFLSFEIQGENIDRDDLLDLAAQLSDVQRKNGIIYKKKISKEEEITCSFSIAGVIDRLINLQSEAELHHPHKKYAAAHCLFYGTAAHMSPDDSNYFLRMLCLQRKSNMRVRRPVGEEQLYIPFDYIKWGHDRRVLAALADLQSAGPENESFIKSSGGLQRYVSDNYHLLYCYFLGLDFFLEKTEKECNSVIHMEAASKHLSLIERLKGLGDIPLYSLSNIEEINTLFEEKISVSSRYLQGRVRDLQEKSLPSLIRSRSCDVFISYRRSNGFYFARLLFELLEKNHKKPFLDLNRLGSGSFDEHIFEVMEHCNAVVFILTKGCLDRCMDEKEKEYDWMRKEIKRALELKQKTGLKIIPLMLDDFVMPLELPKEIDFSKENAVKFSPNSFEGDYQRLCSFLMD